MVDIYHNWITTDKGDEYKDQIINLYIEHTDNNEYNHVLCCVKMMELAITSISQNGEGTKSEKSLEKAEEDE